MNAYSPNFAVLPTEYGGIVYRSRTEARWAVFLDHAGIPFEYEREGYSLRSGYFLPDFWLSGLGCWLEVKGKTPTPREIILAEQLAFATRACVFLGIGAPAIEDIYIPIITPEDGWDGGSTWGALTDDNGPALAARRAFTGLYGNNLHVAA